MDACESCGFVAADYTERDREGTARAIAPMLATMLESIDPDVLATPAIAERVARITALGTAGDPAPGPLHDAICELRRLSRQLHEAGAGAPTQQGTVVQLSTSGGGVPKTPVPVVDIIRSGLVGDEQGNRKHHGRPMQAVSLWSAEVIDQLVAEGHPVSPGAAGENITIGGVDWFTLRPGVRLLVGQALLELSGWATPCRHNDQWFTGRSNRIDHGDHPGWSRAYAWVLEGGTVRQGDPVVVEP